MRYQRQGTYQAKLLRDTVARTVFTAAEQLQLPQCTQDDTEIQRKRLCLYVMPQLLPYIVGM